MWLPEEVEEGVGFPGLTVVTSKTWVLEAEIMSSGSTGSALNY